MQDGRRIVGRIINKSRQAATFEMGLGSSCLEKVVIPYTNSPSTNPSAKILLYFQNANEFGINSHEV